MGYYSLDQTEEESVSLHEKCQVNYFIRDFDQILFYCWATISTTLYQHHVSAFFLSEFVAVFHDKNLSCASGMTTWQSGFIAGSNGRRLDRLITASGSYQRN